MTRIFYFLCVLLFSFSSYATDDALTNITFTDNTTIVVVSGDCRTIGYNGRIYKLQQRPKQEEQNIYRTDITNSHCEAAQ